MNAPQTMPRISPPEVEAHDNALADLRAAESLLAQAVATANAAQWGWLIRCDIARIHTQLRNVLQNLS